MRATRHGLAAVFSAALQLALSFGVAANLVLCSGASGHVAVESAYSADCCDDHVLPDGLARAGADAGCGCVDTPLLQSPLEPPSRRVLTAPSRATALATACVLADAARPLPTAGTAPPSRSRVPEAALAARRSVVLLV